MRRATSALLAATLAGAGAVYVFGPSFSSAGRIGGIINSSPPASDPVGSTVVTGDDFVRTGLGEDVSFEKVTVTGTSSTEDAITILSGRLRMAPKTVASAVIYWDVNNGFNVGNQLNMCDGCYIAVDNLAPKQAAIPLTIGDGDGTSFYCQASPGTCDTTHKGAVVCVSESASSATRLCRCIKTSSSGNFRWLNMDNATRGTTTTDCPDTTP